MPAAVEADRIERALEALRAHARSRVFETQPLALRAIGRTFANTLPVPPLDVAAQAMARGLGEALLLNPARGRRLVSAASERGAWPLAIVGDSHSTHLVRRARRGRRWLLPLHLLCTGASARGLINAVAAAAAGARVRDFLAALAPSPAPVVFKFGQVDVEFVFTFKRLEAGARAFDPAAFDAFAEETIDRYLAFLAEAVPPGLKPRAMVAGVFPPALSDAAWRRGYVDAHIADLHGPADGRALADALAELEIPDLAVRTRLHAAFNARLFAAARAQGFGTLDGFEALLGADGVVAPRFLGRARGTNHHLGYAATRRPIVESLWAAIA